MGISSMLAAVAKATMRHMPHVRITYNLFVGNAFSPSTGAQVLSYYPVHLNAVQEPVNVREIAPGGAGPVQAGDITFLFAYGDIQPSLRYAKSGVLSTSDTIQLDGIEYRAVIIQLTGSNTQARVVARRSTK